MRIPVREPKMTTPNKVIFPNFRDRRSYEKALREQKKADCQGEQPFFEPSTMEDLRKTNVALGAGLGAAEYRDIEAAQSWARIEHEARRFAHYKTPRALVLRLESLIKQFGQNP